MAGITTWANTPPPADEPGWQAHHDQAMLLFSKVNTQHDILVTHQKALIAAHATDTTSHATVLAEAQGTINFLVAENQVGEEILTENRATIHVLSALAHPARASRPVPISDPSIYDGSKEDLEAFLERLANKLRGDAGQFTNNSQQITYPVSHL